MFLFISNFGYNKIRVGLMQKNYLFFLIFFLNEATNTGNVFVYYASIQLNQKRK